MIIWTCLVCGQPIDDGAGYLEADVWSEPWRPRTFEGWRALHRGCDPDTSGSTYWWAVGRLRTGPDLIHAAEHMREKRWWSEREWSDFLASQLSSRVQSSTPDTI